MSPLANDIYRQLLRRARSKHPSITYAELAASLGKKTAAHPRSPKLYAALGEVSQACRHHGLPCLPAIVWRRFPPRPGNGYYKIAHPRAHTKHAQIAAWEREHAQVVSEVERFPPLVS